MSKSPATSQDLEQRGISEFEARKWGAAATSFLEARAAFIQEGSEVKSAEMGNNLCVALLQDNRPQEAMAAVQGTWDIFLAHGELALAARAHGNYGAACEACGDDAGAEKAYRLAAEQMKATGDDDARAQTLAAISRLQLKRGQPLQAIASMQSGIEGQAKPSLGRRILRWILRLPLRFIRP